MASIIDLEPPDVAPGQRIELAGRGTTYVRVLPGPSADAPTLLLLHGWCVTADLNWGTAYHDLTRHFRVIALDHRGHGRGIRDAPFTFVDCADDAAVLLHQLRVGKVVVAGYSMGGPIALQFWLRHQHHVEGLVLGATAASFASSPAERAQFLALRSLGRVARALPESAANQALAKVVYREAAQRFGPWVLEEIGRGSLPGLLAAGGALGQFDGAALLAAIDVPSAVIVTTRDTVVDPARQVEVFRRLPGARRFDVVGDHDIGLTNPERFNPSFIEACQHALGRVVT